MDDAQAAKGVARHFVEALVSGDDLTPYLADGLEWLVVEPTERLGTSSADVDLRRLEVVRLEPGAATVEVVADVHHVLEHPVHGLLDSEADFGGRIELERVGGEWRVTDYTNKGRSVRDAVVRPIGVVEDGPLAISVPALTLSATWTRIALAVENRGPHLVILSELHRGARALGLWHYVALPFMGAVEIPPGSRVVTSASWGERFRLRTRELRFLLRGGEADGPRRFELAFAVRRAPEPRLVALAQAPLLLRAPSRIVRLVRTAPIALFVALLLFQQLRAAGVVFVLYGVAFGAAVGVWASRGRPVRRLVVPVLGTIAVGAWLVWSGGSFV